MATAAIPRTGKMTMSLDPALLIPVVGAGILVYLAVLPLLMLLVGSFQAEVAPREFVYTLKNYHAAYASEYTYSTFLNSLIFASGSAGLGFILGTMLAWLTERTNTPLRGIFVPLAVVPLILPGVLESIAWIFLLSPKFGYLNVWLKSLFGLQSPPFNVFSLPGMIWVHSVGQVPLAFSVDGGGVQIHGPFPGRVGDDVRRQYLADVSSGNFALAHADGGLGGADPVRAHAWNPSRPRR